MSPIQSKEVELGGGVGQGGLRLEYLDGNSAHRTSELQQFDTRDMSKFGHMMIQSN